MSERSRRAWLFGLSLAVSVGLGALLFSRIDAAGVGSLLLRANAVALGLSLLASLAVNVGFSALALRHALAAHGVRLGLRPLARATLGHLSLHAGASAVAGKAARALYVHRALGAAPERAVAAEITLLALKVAALLTLSLSGALVLGLPWVLPCLLVIAGLVVFCLRRGAARSELALSFVWALAMGLGQLAVFALALSALGAPLPGARVFALFPLCLLGAKLPLSVMGLGVRESLVVTLLSGSAPPETLLGASLLFSLVEQVLPGVVGLAFAPRFVARTLRDPAHL